MNWPIRSERLLEWSKGEKTRDRHLTQMSTFIYIWCEYPLPLSAFIIGLEASCAAMSKITQRHPGAPARNVVNSKLSFLDTRFPFSHQTHLSGGWTAAAFGFTYGATYYSFYFAQRCICSERWANIFTFCWLCKQFVTCHFDLSLCDKLLCAKWFLLNILPYLARQTSRSSVEKRANDRCDKQHIFTSCIARGRIDENLLIWRYVRWFSAIFCYCQEKCVE